MDLRSLQLIQVPAYFDRMAIYLFRKDLRGSNADVQMLCSQLMGGEEGGR